MTKDYREYWMAGQIQNGKVTYNKVSNDRALKDFIATVLITLLIIALNL